MCHGQPGTHSLNIPAVGGGVNTGGHLYKHLSRVSTIPCTALLREVPHQRAYVHDGIWMGGHNPQSPGPTAGWLSSLRQRPLLRGAEQTDERTHFDHYNY
jgi:hypothetical protein